MNRKHQRELIKNSEIENAKYPDTLTEVPKETWPKWPFKNDPPLRCLRSKKFMVQEFKENGAIRLSISRTKVKEIVDNRPIWEEGISWEELQEIKQQAGYSDQLAVEIYPKDKDIVNVSNMRHLWIIEGLKIGWTA